MDPPRAAVPLHELPRLPRELESDPRIADVRAALNAEVRVLWPRGTLAVAVVPLGASLRATLAALAVNARVQRGLEAAESALDAERRGLDALPEAVAVRQGQRVSRVVVISNDGAERFYRHVERLALVHAPRVLVCLLDCTSVVLGELLYGPGAIAKLLFTTHKTAATTLLRSLV